MLEGKRILIVEDNEDLMCILSSFFELKGVETDFATNGELGLKLAMEHRFDVIILDVMLPKKDGMQVAKELRENGCITPILMLTALNGQEDLLNGFDAGIDDFVSKPFQFPELEVRLNALIKRFRGEVAKTHLSYAGLEIDETDHQVTRDGVVLETSPVMYQILLLLVKAQGGVVTRDALFEQIWGSDMPDTDLLRGHIYLLRNVLDKPFEHALLKTVPRIGYRLEKK